MAEVSRKIVAVVATVDVLDDIGRASSMQYRLDVEDKDVRALVDKAMAAGEPSDFQTRPVREDDGELKTAIAESKLRSAVDDIIDSTPPSPEDDGEKAEVIPASKVRKSVK